MLYEMKCQYLFFFIFIHVRVMENNKICFTYPPGLSTFFGNDRMKTDFVHNKKIVTSYVQCLMFLAT